MIQWGSRVSGIDNRVITFSNNIFLPFYNIFDVLRTFLLYFLLSALTFWIHPAGLSYSLNPLNPLNLSLNIVSSSTTLSLKALCSTFITPKSLRCNKIHLWACEIGCISYQDNDNIKIYLFCKCTIFFLWNTKVEIIYHPILFLAKWTNSSFYSAKCANFAWTWCGIYTFVELVFYWFLCSLYSFHKLVISRCFCAIQMMIPSVSQIFQNTYTGTAS